MKTEHLLVGLTVFAFLVPSSAAVVGGPEPGEGEMAIAGGSSAGASQAVGPNGTEWKAEVSMVNRTQNVTEDRLENVQYGEESYTVEFDGFITAPTPCHVIDHEVSERDGSYVMNIETAHDQLDEDSNQTGTCAQVLTMIEYDAEFARDESFTLEVRHDNETVDTLYHPGIDEEPEVKRGPISRATNWVRGLLGMQQTHVVSSEQVSTMDLERSGGEIVVEEAN